MEVMKYCACDTEISSVQVISQSDRKRSAIRTTERSIEFEAIPLDIISESDDSVDDKDD